MTVRRSKSRFCEHCAHDDIEFWGYAYWRRIHQVPGIDYCLTHRVPLTVINERAFEGFPPTSIDTKEPTIVPPFAEKYTLIVEALLSKTVATDIRQIKEFIKQRAWEQGLRTSVKGNRPLLSDLILSSAPESWLLSVMPELSEKIPLKCLLPLDGVAQNSNGPRVEAYVLALSLTLDSPDNIVSVLDHPRSFPVLTNAERRAINWNGDAVSRAYLRHRGLYNGIAKEFGVPPEMVRRALGTVGLPDLTNAPQAALPAVEMVFSGASFSDASRHHKVPLEHVEYLMRHNMYRLKKFMPLASGPN